MSIKNSEYDIMLPLFGLSPGDYRIRLYLSTLRDVYDKNQPLVLSSDMEQLKSTNFKIVANNTTIHPEWGNFLADVKNGLSDPANVPTILNTVKLFSGVAVRGSFNHFLQQVIKAHLDILHTDGTNLTDNPDAWISAASVRVKSNLAVFGPVSLGIAGTGAKDFSYNFTKFILYKLLEQSVHPPSRGDSFWDETNNQNETYYRLASNRDLIFTTNAQGQKVNVSRGSDAWNNLDECIGTKVKQNSKNTCYDYISKCIKGNYTDIKACKQFMQDPNFWDVVPKEVNEMLPPIVEDTLNSFGFEITNKNGLRVYESVGSWSQKLDQKGLDDNELNNIRKNTKLTQYLEMLVSKINSNPSILNKEYNAGTGYVFDPIDHSNRFSSWSLSFRGLRPRIIFEKNPDNNINIIRQATLLNTSLLSLRAFANNRVTFVPGTGLVIRGVPMNGMSFGRFSTQVGGRSAVVKMVSPISAYDDNANIRENNSIIKGLLTTAEKMLQSKGQSFDSFTKQQLEEHLENHRKTEQKLIKAIRYADRYIDLLNVYQEYDTENVLSMEHIKKFVDARERYFDKTIGKQNDLLSAIERIATNVNEALDK
jgi:hypothetical protein